MNTPLKLDVTALIVLWVYFFHVFMALMLDDVGAGPQLWVLLTPIFAILRYFGYPNTWESGWEDLLASALVTTAAYLLVKILLTILRWVKKSIVGRKADG